ncbi:protein IWS1 homolog 1 [Selaginella moellendorffii]|uniref:protein IWS1 homolog 1 n=1 Tax=Selaginella moellendorffii TaxID=88036 RepID=UPI000D1CE746|nr:protein IWS1 homolog 1 [Selaginella moellendorffii]|eukprot:XP_024516045.1 protein IWS1 homolog 1 [Selaginella moellendorffii]
MEDYDRDEGGQPIFDPDEDAAEEEWQQPPIEDDWQQQEEDDQPQRREESPSSAHGGAGSDDGDAEEASKSEKPRKRLVKKSAIGQSSKAGRDDERRKPREERRERSSRLFKHDRGGKESEMNEMWNSVAGGNDSEDDNEGQRTQADMAFIDDTGVEPAAHYIGSDDEAGSAGDAPQAEEGEEEDDLKRIFKSGKKRKQAGQTDEEIAALVEHVITKLANAAEDDIKLNRRSKPAINKLKLLPTLVNSLQKRQYQNEFLDRGVLGLLKSWLESLPDGSLPNMNVRTAILQLLTDLPIDLEHEDRREQLKKSGLGKVVMFLSKLDEETPSNKKLAKDLVDKWSRPLFQKSTRYEHLRNYDEERPIARKAQPKKRVMRNSVEDDLLDDGSEEAKPGQPGYRNHASRPEAVAMDFVVRPQSKVDMDEILNSRKQQQKAETKRSKMNKKLQQLRTPKKRKLQAERISVEGRGLVRTV